MGESSPEPLDELDEEPRRRVIRWQSVRVVGEPNGSPASRGLRRTGTVPSMRRPPRRDFNEPQPLSAHNVTGGESPILTLQQQLDKLPSTSTSQPNTSRVCSVPLGRLVWVIAWKRSMVSTVICEFLASLAGRRRASRRTHPSQNRASTTHAIRTTTMSAWVSSNRYIDWLFDWGDNVGVAVPLLQDN
ncbi:hypothetical protein Y032_0073g766 [Ancylostoma ceylanicum]|uniref:Uncharacterized protein n=1 Tax=Ancylostoma ceylanicum TaxID=53326 RepID=A0A016TX17_9BILA|nr:hypothetical protein Y032_0073g766 [Ancylostoma ceylanicum]